MNRKLFGKLIDLAICLCFAACVCANASYAGNQYSARVLLQSVDSKEAPILREAAERRQQYQQLYHPVPVAGTPGMHWQRGKLVPDQPVR